MQLVKLFTSKHYLYERAGGYLHTKY